MHDGSENLTQKQSISACLASSWEVSCGQEEQIEKSKEDDEEGKERDEEIEEKGERIKQQGG